MKILKKLLKALLIFLFIVFIGGWLYSKTFYPTYKGELELTNLTEEVVVYYHQEMLLQVVKRFMFTVQVQALV